MKIIKTKTQAPLAEHSSFPTAIPWPTEIQIMQDFDDIYRGKNKEDARKAWKLCFTWIRSNVEGKRNGDGV